MGMAKQNKYPVSQGFSHESEEWDVSKTIFLFQWGHFPPPSVQKNMKRKGLYRLYVSICTVYIYIYTYSNIQYMNVYDTTSKVGSFFGFQIQQALPQLFCGDDAIWVDWWEMSRRNLADPEQGQPSDKGGWKWPNPCSSMVGFLWFSRQIMRGKLQYLKFVHLYSSPLNKSES